MAISGIVITLSDDPDQQTQTMAKLAADPRLELGQAKGNQLPAVLCTPSVDDDQHAFDVISAVEGVVCVSIAVVHFDDEGVQ